jgi:uncharacterized iron-regulated membrane protein
MSVRGVFVWLHRYVGLAMALFLIIEGVTGSLLAFNGDLAALLNPSLTAARPSPEVQPLDLAALAMSAEALMPRANVWYFFRLRDDQAILRMVSRSDPATGKPYPEDPGLIVLDSYTGKELGRFPYSGYTQGFWANVMPFVYDLHRALALGETGEWILAFLAIFWTIDCFVGFYLTLPVARKKLWSRWKPAWLVKWRGGFYRVNFDLHRAGGLWFWAILFIFAWSSVDLLQVSRTSVYEPVTQTLFDTRPLEQLVAQYFPPREDLGPMKLDWRAAQARGAELAAQIATEQKFRPVKPKELNFFGSSRGYGYVVETDRSFPADKNLTVFFDADDGSLRGAMGSQTGYFGDTLTNWLRGLHMVREPVDYMPYRIFVCLFGLIVAMLSFTGVYIWWKKRKARRFHPRRARASPTSPRALTASGTAS